MGMRRITQVLLITTGAMLVLGVLCGPMVVPKLNCTIDSIDVTSGRRRTERYLLLVKVGDTVQDTELSRLYQDTCGALPQTPMWRTVAQFVPGDPTSPNYCFHRSLSAQKRIAEMLTVEIVTDDEARKAAITHFLQLLQSESDDCRAVEFAKELWLFVGSREATDRMTANDIADVARGTSHRQTMRRGSAPE
jgi:hypothetical protein